VELWNQGTTADCRISTALPLSEVARARCGGPCFQSGSAARFLLFPSRERERVEFESAAPPARLALRSHRTGRDMGTIPKMKRRCLGTGIVSLAAILSALILYSVLFPRPAYLEHLPDVLRPSYDSDSKASSGVEDKTESNVQLDGSDDVLQATSTAKPSSTSTTTTSAATAKTSVSLPPHLKGWKYNPTRDATAYALSEGQCQLAFPGLFNEIERGIAARKDLGNITAEDMDISSRGNGAVHALLLDQQVRVIIIPLLCSIPLSNNTWQLYILQETILENEYDTSRALAILHSLHRAIVTSPEPLPNTEFSFTVADVVPDPEEKHNPIWGLARKEEDEEIWLMSDFGYWSWPLDLVGAYDEVRREIAEAEVDFVKKKKQAVWRGAVATNEHREELIKVTENKEWADVKAIVWAGVSELNPEDSVKALSMPQHCQYQFVIHTEGTHRRKLESCHANTGLTENYRTQLFRPGEVSAKLQLGCCYAQTNVDRATSRTPRGRGPSPELRRGERGLLRLRREGYRAPGPSWESGTDRPERSENLPGPVLDTGIADVLLARADPGLGER
jgi:hypothetical protein